ncbi:MAG: 30S ribosomal protein S27ae [Methanomassiliicoccales archaeon]
MPKEKKEATKSGGKRSLYQVKDGSLVRLRRSCPRCGPGVFLAQHSGRVSCGRCGYAEIEKR